jgi:predicted RNase H-like nuclease (RuvC/YqgF family)
MFPRIPGLFFLSPMTTLPDAIQPALYIPDATASRDYPIVVPQMPVDPKTIDDLEAENADLRRQLDTVWADVTRLRGELEAERAARKLDVERALRHEKDAYALRAKLTNVQHSIAGQIRDKAQSFRAKSQLELANGKQLESIGYANQAHGCEYGASIAAAAVIEA